MSKPTKWLQWSPGEGTCRISRYVTLPYVDGSMVPNDDSVQWIPILVAIYISAWLYGLDTTVVADVQGTVLQRFGEPEKLAWIGVGFPLGSIAIILSL